MRASFQGNRNPLGELVAMKQLMELLKNVGLEEPVMEIIHDLIQGKTKSDKSHSEIVAEFERKMIRAESRAVN